MVRAERRIGRGDIPEQILAPDGPTLSPLAGFIVACRADRWDLARELLPGALRQHRACPLYREASRRLLPPEAYPGDAPRFLPFPTVSSARRPVAHTSELNRNENHRCDDRPGSGRGKADISARTGVWGRLSLRTFENIHN